MLDVRAIIVWFDGREPRGKGLKKLLDIGDSPDRRRVCVYRKADSGCSVLQRMDRRLAEGTICEFRKFESTADIVLRGSIDSAPSSQS